MVFFDVPDRSGRLGTNALRAVRVGRRIRPSVIAGAIALVTWLSSVPQAPAAPERTLPAPGAGAAESVPDPAAYCGASQVIRLPDGWALCTDGSLALSTIADDELRRDWLVSRDGSAVPFGGAPFLGLTGHVPLKEPIVGMAATGPADS